MQDSHPYVSVVLPTYNRAKILLRAIRSVLDQTFTDFELIVVDDGSIDETPSLIRSIADERMIYIQHSLNSGVSAARNSAIHASRGELIAFQDSDDEWQPQKLALQIERMSASDPHVGVVYAQFCRVDQTSTRLFPKSGELLDGDIHAHLLYRNLISAQLALVKRECFAKAGLFDEELSSLVDWELWLRISRTYHFTYVSQPLARVYFTSNGISSNKKNLAHALDKIIQKHNHDFRSHPEALALHKYEIGVLLCLSGEFERGREYLLQVAKINRGLWRYKLAALVSLMGEAIFIRVYELRNRFQPDWYSEYRQLSQRPD